MRDVPSFKEEYISQIPALQFLVNLGYTYLRPSEVYLERGGRFSGILLENILETQLLRLNKINAGGREYEFSDANIKAATNRLKDITLNEGLIKTSERLFDLLSLGESFEQTIDGDKKGRSLKYIDWDNWDKNVFHVTEEFEVERTGSYEKRRPDIVLFVNGIPFVIIECKTPPIESERKDPVDQAISQHLRNQRKAEIPHLYAFAQVLLAIHKNHVKYGTTGTEKKFWAVWREEENIEERVHALANRPLSKESRDSLFADRLYPLKDYFMEIEASGREVWEQDRVLYSLCRPERLLELTYKFIVFDGGAKKVARYQQYFAVKTAMERVNIFEPEGNRKGGVIWHTQGSGKSLTMVMLAKSIALASSIKNPRIILVTDRTDLDDQIYHTFLSCGKQPVQAASGQHLFSLLSENKEAIVTTIINKFVSVIDRQRYDNDSSEIFVLVDEGHRTNYKELHQKMRRVLPKACYISFTGTPLLKKEKNTIRQFGGLIEPTYNIHRAVEDKAVVPILYEGRHVLQKVDKKAIDQWFEVVTKKLTPEQRRDLKKKFTSADQLNKADQKIKCIAYDISEHFHENWQGTWAKGQLAVDSKMSALKFKQYLDEFGIVTSEALISGPDDREGNEEVTDEPTAEVQLFWKKMMDKFGTEDDYNKQLINQFKHGDIEIIIVVDKLLTGFDAPRNTVLYLAKNLKEHRLLQAIARVNRLYEGKDFGFVIDYYGVLRHLGDAMELYGALEGFDSEDLDDTLIKIEEEIKCLPQKYSELLDVFKTVKSKFDEEEYEQLLADAATRASFYDKFSSFNRTLGIALSSFDFHRDTPEEKITLYKEHLIFFQKLRIAVKTRYAEAIDYKEYEAKVQKLINAHVKSSEILEIVEPVNIFETEKFQEEIDKLETTAAKADAIAHRTKKTIAEKMEEDPYFYRRFSKLLQEAIDDFREKRMSEAEYLKRATEVMNAVRDHSSDAFPDEIKHNENAKAFYGVADSVLTHLALNYEAARKISVAIAIKIDEIIGHLRVVDWKNNHDTQNEIRNEIDDYLYTLRETESLDIDVDSMDKIIEESIEIAKKRNI
jgi:type I restriction enzyme, R subunit